MDLADELGVSTVVIAEVCASLGIDARWAGADLTDEEAERVRRAGPPPAAHSAAPPAAMPPPGMPPSEMPPPGLPSPALALSMATINGRTAPRRRDQMVSAGWSLWWQAAGAMFAMSLALAFVGMFASGVSTMSDAYSTGDDSAALGWVVVFLLVLLGGTAWSTLLRVHAASNALDAWNRITRSNGQVKGKGSIVFLVFSAVTGTIGFLVVLAYSATTLVVVTTR